MALSTATISYDFSDQVGTDFELRRTKIWVSTNIADGTVVDTVGNAIRVDTGQGTLAADGTGTVVVWTPGTGSNPDSWQTYVHFDFASPMDRTRKRRTFGPFTVTTSANLADLVEEQEVPAEYLTTITAALDEYVDDAEAAAAAAEAAQAAAEAARDDAIDISGIAATDGVVEALIHDEGSDTYVAVDATFASLVPVTRFGVFPDSAADESTGIQNALDSGLPIYFPPGLYLAHGLVPPNGMRIVGAGKGDPDTPSTWTCIRTTNGDLFASGAAFTSIENIDLQGLGASAGDVLTGAWSQGNFRSVRLRQYRTSKHVVNVTGWIDMSIDGESEILTAAAATVPAFKGVSGGGGIAQFAFRDTRFSGGATWQLHLEGTGGSVVTGVTLDNCNFEIPNGGCMKLLSVRGVNVTGSGAWDLSAAATNDLVYFGASPTAGAASGQIRIEGWSRDASTAPASGTMDIKAESSTFDLNIINCGHLTGERFPVDVGDATGRLEGGRVTLVDGPRMRPKFALASRVQMWGHSYLDSVGIGVTAGVDDLATLVAAGVELPPERNAVGGTTLSNSLSSDASWTSIARDVRRSETPEPLGGLFVVMYGINDIQQLGLTEAALLPYRESLKFAVSRFRAGAFYSDSHETVTLGGGAWSGAADQPYTGGHISYSATNGRTVTIETPADLPAGYVVPIFMTWTDAGGATFTGSDDAAGFSFDTDDIDLTDTAKSVGCLRVPTAGGAGTYVWTTSSVSGSVGAIFMGWQWEPPEGSGPLVALILQPKPLDYTAYGAVSPGPPTDAAVVILNALTVDLAEEFGSRVITVDTSVLDEDDDYFDAGNVHPNVAGTALIAELTVAAIQGAVTVVSAPLDNAAVAAELPPAWAAYVPVLSGTGVTQGNATVSGEFIQQDDDTVHFWARVILGSTSVIGTTTEISLPVALATSAASYMSFTTFLQDAGTAFYIGQGRAGSTASVVRIANLTNAAGNVADVTSTTPFTWVTTDVIEVRGTYRGV